jgi:hypothetical protein
MINSSCCKYSQLDQYVSLSDEGILVEIRLDIVPIVAAHSGHALAKVGIPHGPGKVAVPTLISKYICDDYILIDLATVCTAVER